MKIDYLALQVNDAEELYLPYIAAGTELVLIDTGYPGMSEQIESKLAEKRLSLADVTQIWVTHHDHDHVGSLAAIKSKHPAITVKASVAEALILVVRK